MTFNRERRNIAYRNILLGRKSQTVAKHEHAIYLSNYDSATSIPGERRQSQDLALLVTTH